MGPCAAFKQAYEEDDMLKTECDVRFDRKRGRLLYFGRPADEGYWDEHWLSNLRPEDVRKPDKFVVDVTRRYLPSGARVVDVGCGLARTVYGLHAAGYEAYGVDYAPRTVSLISALAPELRISVGDARRIPEFSNCFFDGVWSLGVIEHFFDGYSEIVAEMARLIRPGGYAFVTVPSMSPLRRLKARVGVYQDWGGERADEFYQFVLQTGCVVSDFEEHGFKLIEARGRGGFKGLKDEVSVLRWPMQKMYDSKLRAIRAIRAAMDVVLSPITFHTSLFVFRKSLTSTAADR